MKTTHLKSIKQEDVLNGNGAIVATEFVDGTLKSITIRDGDRLIRLGSQYYSMEFHEVVETDTVQRGADVKGG